jgi:hypothetical protein
LPSEVGCRRRSLNLPAQKPIDLRAHSQRWWKLKNPEAYWDLDREPLELEIIQTEVEELQEEDVVVYSGV